jgi:hypothetical protein
MKEITADLHTIASQGRSIAIENLSYGVKEVDRIMGKGYSKAHPELLGSVLIAAAIDYHESIVAKKMEELNDNLLGISNSLFNIAENIRLHD